MATAGKRPASGPRRLTRAGERLSSGGPEGDDVGHVERRDLALPELAEARRADRRAAGEDVRATAVLSETPTPWWNASQLPQLRLMPPGPPVSGGLASPQSAVGGSAASAARRYSAFMRCASSSWSSRTTMRQADSMDVP